MNFVWSYLTDIGMKRSSNEDSALAHVLNIDTQGEQNTIGLFIVSDGMGGKSKGELASKIVIKTIGEAFTNTFISQALKQITEISNYAQEASDEEKQLQASPAKFLKKAITEANLKICHIKKGDEHLNVGATVTAGILTDDLLTIGHVGDCRCYIFYDNYLRQVTTDHSVVNEMIRKGLINKEQGANHPNKNILFRSLGSKEDVEVDINVSILNRGCRVLFCTDGLYNMVDDEKIKNILLENKPPNEIVGKLVQEANASGGKDNITALLVNII